MSLNKFRRLTTVKAKLTLFYVVMFMVTQLFCVTLIYLCQRHSVYSFAEKRAAVFANEFTYEYMMGEELVHLAGNIAPDQVDARMMKAILKEEPEFSPATVVVNQRGYTTVLGSVKGVVYGFTSPSGEPAAVTQSRHESRDGIGFLDEQFNGESYGEDVNHIYFLLLSPTGEVLAKSGFTNVDVGFFTGRKLPANRAKAVVKLRNRHEKVFAVYYRLFDGNILVFG